ncbi:MAG: type I-E CRISPR-associated protein Cas7/Cse4/CasC [Acidimicrobiales bacterium]|jgi:CRISPR system Cascade subunit CasC
MGTLRTIIDVHVLQTLPPSCLNRDDTGSPKTAIYGGAARARVSSQSWKRATRRYFNENLLEPDERGIRTRRVVELIETRLKSNLAERAQGRDKDLNALAKAAVAGLGLKEKKGDLSEYALFLSSRQVDAIVELLASKVETGESTVKPEAVMQLAGKAHSLDVALFGRMIADTTSLNVEAACQVAHAISTHRVSPEFDFFTAVDDLNPAGEPGAAMMGYVEFNSATVYRFATVGGDLLVANLGDAAAVAGGVRNFVEAFVKSLPTGHQNTFAAMTLPDLVVVSLRADQPVNLVGAFEEPVSSEGGYVRQSAERLVSYMDEADLAYGVPRVAAWTTSLPAASEAAKRVGEPLPLLDLLKAVEQAVAEHMATNAGRS